MSQETPAIPPAPPELTYAPETRPYVAPERTPAQRRLEVRLWSGFIFALGLGMIAVGLWLTPSPDGIGTHHQMGFPPCGSMVYFHTPCPTCGCTTAVSYVAHGIADPLHLPLLWWKGIVTQPFGAAVGFAALAAILLGGVGLMTGRWRGPQPFTIAWYWRSVLFGSVGLLAGGWVYKIIMVRLGL